MILTATQISHFSRFFRQKVILPKVAIIGGYHGGNLGDMALGLAVSNVLNKSGFSNGLQTIYNLEKWPKVPFAIIGGGAVGYTDSLLKVYERYKGNFSKVGFLGVDFNENAYPKEILEMIRKAAFVSCRSARQAERMKKITQRDIIYNHPDIAFSLMPALCSEARNNNPIKEKKIFVNVLPLYGKFVNGRVEPILKYKEERPELFDNFSLMHKSYETALRNSVIQGIEEGFEIESAPFTGSDSEYCKVLLKGLPVKFPAYYSDPIKMLKNISTGERVISTRFHTTIFGLKTGAVLQPIAYAKKNELMLKELGICSENFLSTTDLANGKNNLPIGFKGDEQLIGKWEAVSKEMIAKCIQALGEIN